jgi:diguanylate cyclase (GGDEF)-like protein/PAS domain S-box-containing protein
MADSSESESLARALEIVSAAVTGPLAEGDAKALASLAKHAIAERDTLQQLVEHVPALLYIDKLSEPGSGSYPTLYVGPQVETVLGITRQEWIEGDEIWQHHMDPDDWPTARREYDEYLTRGGVLVQEYRFVRPDNGKVVWIRDDCTTSRDPVTGESIVLGVMFDITRQKQLEEQLKLVEQQLEFRAYHDPLTGLANRPLFDESLEQALTRARRHSYEVVVLFVDVDGFKQINDAYGHDAGDEALRVIATRLQSCARESDLVARRGGDEFLLLLSDIDAAWQSSGDEGEQTASLYLAHQGDLVAEHITERIVESMSVPIDLSDVSVTLSLSVGRCVYPWDATDSRTMMAAADASMYSVKQSPKPQS